MNKYGCVEHRDLPEWKLRKLCIDNEWYYGHKEEYMDLFSRAKKMDLSTDDIVAIAMDIIEHSNMDVIDLCRVCYLINDVCDTIFTVFGQ